MNDEVREWTLKAEGDFLAATQLRDGRFPNHDAVCFHAQQCIEKLMKAILVAHGITPPRTHELSKLEKQLRSVRPEPFCDRKELRFLSRCSVAFRYPGESATAAHASAAMSVCTRVREVLLAILGGPASNHPG